MNHYIRQFGKYIYKKLPGTQRKALLKKLAPLMFKKNTEGITPNGKMVEWSHSQQKPVSIVIPSYNDYPLLKACIESINATCQEMQYEIIVVDDYCQPENTENLKSLESETVRVILKDSRGGFAVTVNRGTLEAKYDIVLLNSDIVAQPGWLEALQYSAYMIDEKIGMVSPKLVYPDGRIQYGGTYYARVLAPQWFGHLFVGRPATTPVANVPFYNRSISGACVYIKKEVYKELGGLDEKYWLGFEDVDYGLRAWRAGIRCYYQPASMLIHYESASRGYSQGKRELSSMRYFWSNWSNIFMYRQADQKVIDYVYSDNSSELWQEYIQNQAQALRKQGFDIELHHSNLERDEVLIQKLSNKNSIKVCCDRGAVTTTWLAALEKGKAVYMLPAIESVSFPHDPQKQAEIIAHYRPEFDYISPSRFVENQLRLETAWESQARVSPSVSLSIDSLNNNTSTEVVIVTDDAVYDETVTAIIPDGFDTKTISWSAIKGGWLDQSQKNPPKMYIIDAAAQQSLPILALMQIAPVAGLKNDKTQYEIMDGYNTLLGESVEALRPLLNDILGDSTVWEEVYRNGRDTAQSIALMNGTLVADAYRDIAQRSI